MELVLDFSHHGIVDSFSYVAHSVKCNICLVPQAVHKQIVVFGMDLVSVMIK